MSESRVAKRLLIVEGFEAEAFLANKACDTNELLDTLKEAHISAVIPSVKSRKEQRAYNHESDVFKKDTVCFPKIYYELYKKIR